MVWALNSEIQTTSLKSLVGDGADVKDGERLGIIPKVRITGGGVCDGAGSVMASSKTSALDRCSLGTFLLLYR